MVERPNLWPVLYQVRDTNRLGSTGAVGALFLTHSIESRASFSDE